MQRDDHWVAKFIVRYDGPYTVVEGHPESSTYTLDLPSSSNAHPTFYSSLLCLFIPNDNTLFPLHRYPEPGLIVTADGQEEFYVDRWRCGHGWQYLVRW